MKRRIESILIEWKNRQHRKPLVLRGARQVGKTWTVTRFGREHFRYPIILDLEKDRNLHKLFGSDLSAQHLKVLIEASTGQPLVPGETFLFLDEIQACPRALMALRYFHEEMPSAMLRILAGVRIEDICPGGPRRVRGCALFPSKNSWATGWSASPATYPPRARRPRKLRQLKLYSVIGCPEPSLFFEKHRGVSSMEPCCRVSAGLPRANRLPPGVSSAFPPPAAARNTLSRPGKKDENGRAACDPRAGVTFIGPIHECPASLSAVPRHSQPSRRRSQHSQRAAGPETHPRRLACSLSGPVAEQLVDSNCSPQSRRPPILARPARTRRDLMLAPRRSSVEVKAARQDDCGACWSSSPSTLPAGKPSCCHPKTSAQSGRGSSISCLSMRGCEFRPASLQKIG